jgi:hypothetical protein
VGGRTAGEPSVEGPRLCAGARARGATTAPRRLLGSPAIDIL